MAPQAQRPNIRQIALAATLRHRRDVVGIPQARAPQILQAPVAKHAYTPPWRESLDAPPFRDRIQVTGGAHPLVAIEYLVSQISRVGAQAPFVDTPVRAEGPSPRRYFQAAPTAQGSAARTARQFRSLRAPAAHCTILAPRPRIQWHQD